MKHTIILIILMHSCPSNAGISDLNIAEYTMNCNEKYVSNCTFNLAMNGTQMVFNSAGLFLHPWNELVTVSMSSFKLKDGVFKKSIFNYDMNFCDFVRYDPLGFPVYGSNVIFPVKKTNFDCPWPIGWLKVKDLIVRKRIMPKGFDPGTWKLCGEMVLTKSKDLLAGACVILKANEASSKKIKHRKPRHTAFDE